MEVTFTVDKAIARNGIDVVRYKKGDTVNVDDDIGKGWIDLGWVEEVKPKPVRKFEPEETPEKPKKSGRPKKDDSE